MVAVPRASGNPPVSASIHFCLPSVEALGTPRVSPTLCGFWGLTSGPQALRDKHVINGAISLAVLPRLYKNHFHFVGACMSVYPRGEPLIIWNWVYRWLEVTMWDLGIEPGFCGRAALNC